MSEELLPWLQVGTSVLGMATRGATPAGPAISAANPVSSSLFDSSGWSINFGNGYQSASSSPSNSASPVVSNPATQLPYSPVPGGNDQMLMLGAGLLLLVLLWR